MFCFCVWPSFIGAVLSVIRRTIYQCKVDMDMLNAVKNVLADISSVSPSLEQKAICDKKSIIKNN